jgi:hypothetical protein
MNNTALETILKLSAALTGALIGWITILRPIWAAHKAKKANRQEAIEKVIVDDKAYRKTVLDKLGHIEVRLDAQDATLASMQRGDIERAYCMFVIEHGYCPSGMKENIAEIYAQYTAKGFNHIAQSRVAELLALPEFPKK